MLPPLPSLLVPNAPKWAQGMSMWADYQAARGSGLLFPPGVDTHAATIYAPSSAGVYQPFGANVPVLTDLSLQTVPTRTNSLRNSSAGGSTTGVIGSGGAAPTNWSVSATGLTRTIVGTGIENGLPYIDVRLNGTTGSTAAQINFETSTQIAASNGQSWASSVFCKMVAGSLTNISAVQNLIYEWAAGGVYIKESGVTFTPTADIQRVSNARALDGGVTVAATSNAIQITYSASVAVDITLRIYAPQMELGAFSSSPILTTSAAATVNGNQQVVSGLGTQLASGVAGIIQLNLLAVSTGFLIDLSDGTDANRIVLQPNSGALRYFVDAASSSIFGVSGGTLGAGVATIAFIAGPNYFDARMVGQAAVGPVTTGAYPAVNQIGIGGRGFAASINGYQFTKKLALDFTGPFNQAKFDAVFAKAQLAAAA